MKRNILCLCLFVLFVTCLRVGQTQGTPAPLNAESIAKEWQPPHASVTEDAAAKSEGKTLLVQHIKHQLPFSTLWQFYASKCGSNEKFAANTAYVTGGKGKAGEYVLFDDLAGQGHIRTNFVLSAPDYMVTVTLERLDAKSTFITLIVGMRPHAP